MDESHELIRDCIEAARHDMSSSLHLQAAESLALVDEDPGRLGRYALHAVSLARDGRLADARKLQLDQQLEGIPLEQLISELQAVADDPQSFTNLLRRETLTVMPSHQGRSTKAEAEVLPPAPEQLATAERRIAELAAELRLLHALQLDGDSIRTLVDADRHDEVCERFAEARRIVGLKTLEPALHSYQRAIGVPADPKDLELSIEGKRQAVSLLGRVADSLGADFEVGEHFGRLDVVPSSATGSFRLRSQSAGAGRPIGLKQRIPLLGLRPRC